MSQDSQHLEVGQRRKKQQRKLRVTERQGWDQRDMVVREVQR